MAYDLIKISALPAVDPDDTQDVVIGAGDYLKRVKYSKIKDDMVGTSPSYTTDTEPYLMRRTAHTGVVGKCALNKLVGGSLGWNQIIQKTSTGWNTHKGTSSYDSSTNEFTCTFTEGALGGLYSTTVAASIPQGHKVLICATIKASRSMGFRIYCNNANKTFTASTSYAGYAVVLNTGAANELDFYATTLPNVGDIMYIKNAQLIDLTLDFGSTIADYVYSLENSSSGSGIAWLSEYIDLTSYHEYDAGSIQSVQATAHVTTGKNLLEVTGTTTTRSGITFAPQTDGSIVCNGTATALVQFVITASFTQTGDFILTGCPSGGSTSKYDLRTDSVVDGGSAAVDFGTGIAFSKSTHANTQILITIRSGYVCNNLVFRPMIRLASVADATYEPYTAHTYPLGSDTLRGIPQLVSNKLAYDGDEKTPDGTIRRKYGIVDLGSLDWTYASSSGRSFFTTLSTTITPSPKLPLDNSYAFNAIIAGYDAAPMTATFRDRNFGADASGSGNRLLICDNRYSTAAAFKTAVTGLYMVYKLETESTESSTSFQKVQTIDADGTESFTVSSPVPVGHETQTADNILAALGWLGE